MLTQPDQGLAEPIGHGGKQKRQPEGTQHQQGRHPPEVVGPDQPAFTHHGQNPHGGEGQHGKARSRRAMAVKARNQGEGGTGGGAGQVLASKSQR